MLHPPSPATEREYLIEIYAQLQHVHEMIEQIAGDLRRQNDRIGRLETWRNRIAGGLVIGGVVAGAVVSNAVKALTGGPGP